MKNPLYLIVTICLCIGAFLLGRMSVKEIPQPITATIEFVGQTEPETESTLSSEIETIDATSATIIAVLEQQIAALEKSNARYLKRYQMVRPFQHPPVLGFDYTDGALPGITEKTYEYLQLEPKEEQELRKISKAFIDDLLSWEQNAANNLQQLGNRIEIDIRPMNDEERNQRLHYREQLKDILEKDEFELIDGSLANAVRPVFQNRKISIEPITENGVEMYNIEVFYFDREGNSAGHSTMTTPNAPTRYAHLFENLENL